MHREKNDLGRQPFFSDGPRGRETIHHGHVNIENRHSWRMSRHRLNRFLTITCLGDDAQTVILLDRLAQTLSHDRMVVRYYDSDLVLHHCRSTHEVSAPSISAESKCALNKSPLLRAGFCKS
jgi:hypothetical protein